MRDGRAVGGANGPGVRHRDDVGVVEAVAIGFDQAGADRHVQLAREGEEALRRRAGGDGLGQVLQLRVRQVADEPIASDAALGEGEEFDAVKDMARLAREENEALKSRIAALEAKLGVSPAGPDVGSPKTDG